MSQNEIDDLLNEMTECFEEDLKDGDKYKVEQELNMDSINESINNTLKWMESERQMIEDAKNSEHSQDAFKSTSTNSTAREYYQRQKEKEEEKKESTNKGPYYSSYFGSTTTTKEKTTKTPERLFAEKVDKELSQSINRMMTRLEKLYLNKIEEKAGEWDILDLQYELNKRKINRREYANNDEATKKRLELEKRYEKIKSKIKFCEMLNIMKSNPADSLEY